jgi:hypothetical protein
MSSSSDDALGAHYCSQLTMVVASMLADLSRAGNIGGVDNVIIIIGFTFLTFQFAPPTQMTSGTYTSSNH